MVVIYYTW